jgi:hypothetical protein
VQTDGVFALKAVPRGSGFDAVSVQGPDCGLQTDFEGCVMWVQTSGEKPESWYVSPHGVNTERPEFRKVVDVTNSERAAGITEVHDDLTTCSGVETATADTPVWTTCDHQLLAFSPDGGRVLAQPDGDGLGPVGLAVYDSDGGKLLLDLDVADQGYIRQMVWEDDTHVLATVYEKSRWATLRIGLDGSREYAVSPVAGEDAESPFALPAR